MYGVRGPPDSKGSSLLGNKVLSRYAYRSERPQDNHLTASDPISRYRRSHVCTRYDTKIAAPDSARLAARYVPTQKAVAVLSNDILFLFPEKHTANYIGTPGTSTV